MLPNVLAILVEKPFATSVEEGNAMKEAIQKNGVKCLVAFENRWNIPITAVINGSEQGQIGEVYTVNARLNDTIFVRQSFLPAKNSTIGWFLFLHITDPPCLFKGRDKKVQSIYAVGTKKKLAAMNMIPMIPFRCTKLF